MAKSYMEKEFLNKEVQIYPGDTNHKYGIVKDINDAGIVFEITKYFRPGQGSVGDSQYEVGKLIFISFSSKLTFKRV